jgi:uncharacterized oxidoreductase
VTVFPGPADTPMLTSNRVGAELGFDPEPASAVAAGIVEGIEKGKIEVMRGGEVRMKMVALNRQDPAAVDEKFMSLKPALEAAVRDHKAL